MNYFFGNSKKNLTFILLFLHSARGSGLQHTVTGTKGDDAFRKSTEHLNGAQLSDNKTDPGNNLPCPVSNTVGT